MARASLEELRLDYEDFLRHRSLPLWLPEDARRSELVAKRFATAEAVAAWIAQLHGQNGRSGLNGRPTYPGLAANALLVLIGVACALLDRQIQAQAATFTEEGGFTERLYRIRSEHRRPRP